MSSLRQGLGLVPLVPMSSRGQTNRGDGNSDGDCVNANANATNGSSDNVPKNSSLIRIGGLSNCPLIIGRVELLKSFHAACDGDDGKLKRYKEANRWGVRSLSRRLLKFSEFGVQVRGEHAIVRINGVNVRSKANAKKYCATGASDGKTRQNEWFTPPLEIKSEDIISFEPVGVKDRIEFKVVSLNKEKRYEQGTMSRKCLPDSENKDPTQPRTSRQTIDELSNQHDIHPKETFKHGKGHEIQETFTTESKQNNLDTSKKSVDNCSGIRPEKNSFRVHFFPYGNGFSASRRQKLERNFELLGATIEDNVWKANYIVISETIRSLETVAKRLSVEEKKLRQHLEENTDIRCVMPSWADDCIMSTKRIDVPSRIHFWCYGPTINITTADGNSTKRKRDGKEPMDDFLSKKKGDKNDDEILQTRRQNSFPRNILAAEAFKILANLQQSMPLLAGDEWRAYSFRIVAGRLLELDFEVNGDDDTQQRLKSIKGFGDSVCEKIQECIKFGTIKRINEFKSDERRQAMKAMTDIWGVGPVKARELTSLGLKTIVGVRKAIDRNEIFLERNQLVGVDCYEDILDRMPRSEVEEIGEMVRLVAERLFPGIEMSIMGSYRRKQDDCGDVDILLCHPDYIDTISSTALGQIIDALWNEGKIAFHLTFLIGMTTGCHWTDYEKSSQYVPNEAWRRAKIQSKQTQCDFYMGCLYSPKNPKVRRRVDIKLYPYRERAFATLYFTGNGYFNRSMRLWATRVFNYTLNDHGLFDRRDGRTRVFEASTEREIFNHLELVYRSPHERHYWDSLEPIKEGHKPDLTMNSAEFKEDGKHRWVE